MELTVRSWRDDEEDEFVGLATDPRVTSEVGDGTAWSRERARARFRRARKVVDTGRGCWWRVGDRDGHLVGLLVAELDPAEDTGRDPRAHGSLEIGYWVVPERWGQGCATALVGIAVHRLVEQFPGTDLRAETHLDNVASAAVLLRAGFAEEARGTGRYGAPVRRFRRETGTTA